MTALTVAVAPSRRNALARGESFVPVIIASLAFHIVVFVGIPFFTRMLYHADTYERPKTFTLVTMPNLMAQLKVAQAAQKKPKGATPVPSKSRAKNQVKKNEKSPENTDQLNELLDALPATVSDITPGQSFKYAWYINSVVSKVEENWKPPMGLTDKKDASVTVVFTIFPGGDISTVTVTESSGVLTLDNLALRAVQTAAPFGKLPVGYQMDRLDIKYVLHYIRQ